MPLFRDAFERHTKIPILWCLMELFMHSRCAASVSDTNTPTKTEEQMQFRSSSSFSSYNLSRDFIFPTDHSLHSLHFNYRNLQSSPNGWNSNFNHSNSPRPITAFGWRSAVACDRCRQSVTVVAHGHHFGAVFYSSRSLSGLKRRR